MRAKPSSSLRRRLRAAAMLGSLALAGCGGGGSTSVVPPPGTTFPLQSALAALLGAGYTRSASVSGSAVYQGSTYPVSGTLILSASALTPSPTLFAGQAALVTTLSTTGSVSVAGQTLPLSSSAQAYFTSTLAPLGHQSSSSYCVAPTPGSYPTAVQVGDSGPVATYSCYTDSTLSTPLGTETLSYRVSTAYSTTTATVSLVDEWRDLSGVQTFAETDNYVISTTGSLALVSGTSSQTDSGVVLNIDFTVQ